MPIQREAVALLAELLGQLGDVVSHDLFNLSNVLVGDDLLASLLVDDFLSLVEALLNGALDIEAHGGLLSALSRSKASLWVRGLPGWAENWSVMLWWTKPASWACM